MRALLAEIARATDTDNPWLGEARAQEARAELERLADAPSRDRLFALMKVAEQELRLGREHQAIQRFEEARDLAEGLGPILPARERAQVWFRLGVGHLRHGETSNCAQRPAAESCILPIRGGGIHTDETGSKKAITSFERVLELVPQSSPLFVKTVWLLNIAHMTLGVYPNGVPERYRVPPHVFAARGEFRWFPNVASEVGVDTFNLSGGVVADDFDGDGDIDLLTTSFDTRAEPHFFRNQGDGTFQDDTESAGLRGFHGGLQLIHGDVDNDGDLDVFVTRGAWLYERGRHPNSLLLNDGRARFRDATFAAGLGDLHLPTQAAAFADYDNDGDLDLFVGNEHGTDPDRVLGIEAGNESFDAPSQLFQNQGSGTFVDVAATSGMDLRGYVKGATWGDYDNDGDADLYVSILGQSNRLYENRGDQGFHDVAEEAGVADAISSFPVWFWDYDNDGNLDLYVSSYAGAPDSVSLVAASYFGLEVPYQKPRLYRGNGKGRFEDVAKRAGLERIHLTMGSSFGDLDGDGWLDFYLGTGYPDYEGLMPNVLYRNDAGRRFVDVTLASGLAHLQKGHGVAIADFDGDGDLDVFEQMGGAFPGDRFADALYRNPGFGKRFIELVLVGEKSNRSAIGARVRVDLPGAPGEGRSLYRTVMASGSFGGNPLRQLIGLGDASSIDRVEIWWPASGLRQVVRGLRPGDRVKIREGRDTPEPLLPKPAATAPR